MGDERADSDIDRPVTFQSDQPPKPFGRAIPWTNADLDRMAEVTPADIEEARLFWIAYAPPPFKALLDAEEVE